MSSFSYDFSVLGGDARQVFLAEMLAESGRSLCHYALASQPNNCSSVSEHVSIVREAPSLEEACIHSGSVICPFPFTKNGADVSVENSIYRFSIQTLLHLPRPGQSLFAGGIPPIWTPLTSHLLKKKPPKITSLFLIMQTIYRFLFTTVSRLQKAQSAKRSSTVLSICTKADAQYLDSENAVTLLFTV